jgi:hypothetical protein
LFSSVATIADRFEGYAAPLLKGFYQFGLPRLCVDRNGRYSQGEHWRNAVVFAGIAADG